MYASQTELPAILPRFVIVTPEIGIDFKFYSDAVPDRFFLPEIMGGGIAWIDLDGDGWQDLFHANGCVLDPALGKPSPSSRLWRNVHGERFVEITDAANAALTMYGQGCAVADYDADGFSDIYVAGYGPDRLLHNQGDGTFKDVTIPSETSNPEWTSSVIWVDLDGDRDLDLYAANYLNVTLTNHKVCNFGGPPGYCGPGSYEAVQDSVYINQADGTFVESSERMGFRADNGKGLAVAAVDLDDDLIPEIYVANDMTPNFLFQRQSSPDGAADQARYVEVASQSGCAVSGAGLCEASMGIAIADFDADGRTDIYLTHYYHMKNTLYRNLGGLVFDDVSNWSRTTATSYESLGFGTAPVDYDRDGDPDVFVSNGHVLGPAQQPNEMKPQLLRNDHGIFQDVSSLAGTYFQNRYLGRSVAACDYDNDGDVDLAVNHLDYPFVLLRNDTPAESRPFVGLNLSTSDRTVPVGGRVIVHTDRRSRTHPIYSGGSYLAAQDVRILLSWPDTETLKEIEMRWASGRIDHWKDLSIRRYWTVREGREPAE